jgi:predicted transcriptional regulator
MEKEVLNVMEHLNVAAVKYGETVKRYELSPESGYGFYRKSEDVVETGLVVFPAARGLENILADIEIREI